MRADAIPRITGNVISGLVSSIGGGGDHPRGEARVYVRVHACSGARARIFA